jgi:hypothetical protein
VFFQAGGAAGTIAKSISAYDMTFSDAIYGKSPRYVSQDRLDLMLGHEYVLLTERLSAQRGEKTTFFVFADTVSARNFKGTNECHGWMGIRFQTEPGGRFISATTPRNSSNRSSTAASAPAASKSIC